MCYQCVLKVDMFAVKTRPLRASSKITDLTNELPPQQKVASPGKSPNKVPLKTAVPAVRPPIKKKGCCSSESSSSSSDSSDRSDRSGRRVLPRPVPQRRPAQEPQQKKEPPLPPVASKARDTSHINFERDAEGQHSDAGDSLLDTQSIGAGSDVSSVSAALAAASIAGASYMAQGKRHKRISSLVTILVGAGAVIGTVYLMVKMWKHLSRMREELEQMKGDIDVAGVSTEEVGTIARQHFEEFLNQSVPVTDVEQQMNSELQRAEERFSNIPSFDINTLPPRETSEGDDELQQQTERELQLEAQHARGAAERQQQAKAEAERLQQARGAAERLQHEHERAEAERLQHERAEVERLQHARAEAERLQQARAEAERLQQARAEAERLQHQRTEAERLQQARAEAERLQQARAEAERLQQDMDVERRAQERAVEVVRSEQARIMESEQSAAAGFVSQDVPQDVPQDEPQDVPQDVPHDVPEKVMEQVSANGAAVQTSVKQKSTRKKKATLS